MPAASPASRALSSVCPIEGEIEKAAETERARLSPSALAEERRPPVRLRGRQSHGEGCAPDARQRLYGRYGMHCRPGAWRKGRGRLLLL